MTDEERQNLENYLHVGRLVEFMKAKGAPFAQGPRCRRVIS